MKQEAGIWLYPSGKYGSFLYEGRTSKFLGTVETLEAAREARAKAKADLRAGRAPAARMAVKVTLATFFDETYAATAFAGKKDSTKRAALSRFNAHLRRPLGGTALGAIRHAVLEPIRARIVARADLSGQTKREVILLLRQVLEEAVRHGLLPMNPAATLTLARKDARKIEIPPLAKVQGAIVTITHPVARMLAELLLMSGLRLNEATALSWTDLDLAKRKLSVCRTIDPATKQLTTPKTGESFRTIDIPSRLVARLKAYRKVKPSDGWVFPSEGDGPFDGRNFAQRYWAPAVTAAGIPDITPHGLRHLFASALLQSGAEILYVANQLGHTRPGFTLNQYGHLMRDTTPSREKLEGAFSGKRARRGA